MEVEGAFEGPAENLDNSTEPPCYHFPKPDFTEIVQDDKSDSPALTKPTFKNILQAKKRLQAFSSNRASSLPSSPITKKVKNEEKSEDSSVMKKSKKGAYHEDKAKAVIEEIEEIKRNEQAFLESHRQAMRCTRSRTRSRSRSFDKERERFKKVEKKTRNYRRRSPSVDKPKKMVKKPKKYPKNWGEFIEFDANFSLNHHFEIAPTKGNNEIVKQLSFETPSLPIVQFKMKTVNREEKVVPFSYIRYTQTKPHIPFSVNFTTIQENFLTRSKIFEALPKETVANIEKLYTNSIKFRPESPSKSKSRLWYQKIWKDLDNECKLLENSIGLSFLQNYTGEEDVIEEDVDKSSKMIENIVKKKKKMHKRENSEEKSDTDKKKRIKKKKNKEKKKHQEDNNLDNNNKKKKRKKDKVKRKESQQKDKKTRNKKSSKERQKKKVEEVVIKLEKSNKEQVIEELRQIEEQLAKTRENKFEDKEKCRKRKHSENEETTKRIKQEKPAKVIIKKEENVGEEVEKAEQTPDTDEYHSHWESDDDVTSTIPRHSVKLNRSWESDEELFDRTYSRKPPLPTQNYGSLEIPLNIKKFSRRDKWEDKPSNASYFNEFKLLEEERRSLSEERRKLEIEKQRILKLHEEAKLAAKLDEKRVEAKEMNRMRSSTPEVDLIKVKKEKTDISDFNIDSLNSSLLSNVSSSESNFPIAALENEYEEFIKAVSTDNNPPLLPPPQLGIETPITVKQKESSSRSHSSDDSSDSSSSSDSSDDDSDDQKKKKRKKERKKRKKKKKNREGLLLGGKSNIFNEFDIPVPSDLPEMVPPTPVPVPSPIDTILPSIPSTLLLNSIITTKGPPPPPPPLPETKTTPEKITFSTLILPNKKQRLLDNSNLKLDDDSDTEDFTEKIIQKEDNKEEKVAVPAPVPDIPEPGRIENVEKEKVQKRHSPNPSKRRSRSRSRERRRSPGRRRDMTPPSRRRYSSPPRRRSPIRRRLSPRRRSPSPRRRSSPRRRRRSPSFSPLRRGGTRKRTPSPRIRRSSPLNSPLDGFKRSVADSTISDDMLPQPTNDDYSESPTMTNSKYYDRKSKRTSISPQISPRRISLDDRINQVLGLEKNEPPIKLPDMYPNYNYNLYEQQYSQYAQYPPSYGPQKSEFPPQFVQPMYTQPPPPIVKTTPSLPPTKVVQVGNILQVVPTEELPTKIETKPPETGQKIVQVGNMLQIVPATKPLQVIDVTPKPVPLPEKQSAEALMKQKIAERKAEREKRRMERERRRKEKEKKRKEREKRKQLKLKLKAENMIKRAIQMEAEALASEDIDEGVESNDTPIQWPPISVISTPTTVSKGILLAEGSSRKRKSVQFADGVKPGEGTSPSGGEELSSPPPHPPKLPKEKRYKKIKIPKKSKKKKIKVKIIKKLQNEIDDDEDDDDDNNLPPPSPPPGSPPPHVFPSRVKTHTINNVHPYVIPNNAAPPGFPYRPPMQPPPMVINRPPPGFLPGAYHTDVNPIVHQSPFQGVPSHH